MVSARGWCWACHSNSRGCGTICILTTFSPLCRSLQPSSRMVCLLGVRQGIHTIFCSPEYEGEEQSSHGATWAYKHSYIHTCTCTYMYMCVHVCLTKYGSAHSGVKKRTGTCSFLLGVCVRIRRYYKYMYFVVCAFLQAHFMNQWSR